MKRKFWTALAVAILLSGCSQTGQETTFERAKAHFIAGEWDDAIADCRQELKANPGNSEAYILCGRAFAGRGDLDQAIAAYDDAIRLAPGNAEPYYNRAIAYREKGKLDQAADDERLARERDPVYAKTYLFSPTAPSLKVPVAELPKDDEVADDDDGVPNLSVPEPHKPAAPGTKAKSADDLSEFSRSIEDKPSGVLKDAYGLPLDTRLPSEKLFGPAPTAGQATADQPKPKFKSRPAPRLTERDEQEQPEQPREQPRRSARSRTPSIGELNTARFDQQRTAAQMSALGLPAEGIGTRNNQYPASPFSGITVGPFAQPKIRSTGQSGFDLGGSGTGPVPPVINSAPGVPGNLPPANPSYGYDPSSPFAVPPSFVP